MLNKKIITYQIPEKINSPIYFNKKIRAFFIDILMKKYLNEIFPKIIQYHQRDILIDIVKTNLDVTVDLITEVLHEMDISDSTIKKLEYATGGAFHYSQEGEDIILSRIFSAYKKGFFIDIGAHHPIRFSNTYTLYRRGWRGLNIDATPDSMKLFDHHRSEDINIECAISDSIKKMEFYIFKEPALNTFDNIIAEEYINLGWELQEIKELQTEPLQKVLDNYWPQNQPINLMNIDVEGQEMGVLLSNNWDKYKPDWIIIEVLDTAWEHLPRHPCIWFLHEIGYHPVSKLKQSVILSRD